MKEVDAVIQELAMRTNANVLLIGQGGADIAREVAQRIKSHPELQRSRVLFVNIDELLSAVSPKMEQLHVVTKAVLELEQLGKVIAVLNGMSGVFAGEYAQDPEDVLYPFFSSPSMHTITILSEEEYYSHIAPNTELARFVAPVPVQVLSPELPAARIVHLDERIHARVVNQGRAIGEIRNAMVHAQSKQTDKKHPIASLLCIGPTGVGKTETAKALAEIYFGSDEYVVELHMQEFQNVDALVPKLTALITEHPSVVLLLDGLEKASQPVQQLFVRMFDEGYVEGAYGRAYACTQMIIIAKSNTILSPELNSHFDGIITFTSLSAEHTQEIASRMLVSLNMQLDERYGVGVQITDELIDYIVSVGYSPESGASGMPLVIQNTVERVVKEIINKGGLIAGQSMRIDPRQFA